MFCVKYDLPHCNFLICCMDVGRAKPTKRSRLLFDFWRKGKLQTGLSSSVVGHDPLLGSFNYLRECIVCSLSPTALICADDMSTVGVMLLNMQ